MITLIMARNATFHRGDKVLISYAYEEFTATVVRQRGDNLLVERADKSRVWVFAPWARIDTPQNRRELDKELLAAAKLRANLGV